MNALDKIYDSNKTPEMFAKKYMEYVANLLVELDMQSVAKFMDIMIEARKRKSRIFFLGNGGSAATASHFSNDMAIGVRCPKNPFKAVSITDNVAVLSCIGNDFGYDELFTKQLEVFMEKDDVVVVISASGNSQNLVKAVKYANSKQNQTVGLLGFDGGELKNMCSHVIHVKTEKGEYGPVEDVHMVVDHLMNSFFIRWAKESANCE